MERRLVADLTDACKLADGPVHSSNGINDNYFELDAERRQQMRLMHACDSEYGHLQTTYLTLATTRRFLSSGAPLSFRTTKRPSIVGL